MKTRSLALVMDKPAAKAPSKQDLAERLIELRAKREDLKTRLVTSIGKTKNTFTMNLTLEKSLEEIINAGNLAKRIRKIQKLITKTIHLSWEKENES